MAQRVDATGMFIEIGNVMVPLTVTRAISQVKRRPNLSFISYWSIRKLQLNHT